MNRLGIFSILAVPIFSIVVVSWNLGVTQQVGDTEFDPQVNNPAYPPGTGPAVFIDQAHNNLHTVSRTYRTLATLLRRDGYRVNGFESEFTKESLQDVDVLIISNALDERGNISLPTHSAFSSDEIDAVHEWIDAGGSLLLIADHMPFAGAVSELAERLGIFIHNGYAMTPGAPNPLTFRREDNSLRDHPIVRGRSVSEQIPYVATFGGQAFRLREGIDATPLMVFRDQSRVIFTSEIIPAGGPKTPVELMPWIYAEGLLQGAALEVGAGRVVMSGEAAMFSAQTYGPDREPFGMNDPSAPHNLQFVLNVLHWLTGILEDQ